MYFAKITTQNNPKNSLVDGLQKQLTKYFEQHLVEDPQEAADFASKLVQRANYNNRRCAPLTIVLSPVNARSENQTITLETVPKQGKYASESLMSLTLYRIRATYRNPLSNPETESSVLAGTSGQSVAGTPLFS